MKKTKSFKDLSRRDGLNLKRPLKARVNLALLAGTVFSLAAVPSFASSPAVGSPTADATSSQVAPETFLIKGSIKDSKGEALIGVNVIIRNSSNGTITDFNGEFSLRVSNGDVLEISYVGYKPVTLTVSPKASYQIVMQEDTETLEEVVVTALGIKRETKSLTYNVQEVKSDVVTAVKDASFVNSLTGKIAGVTINQSCQRYRRFYPCGNAWNQVTVRRQQRPVCSRWYSFVIHAVCPAQRFFRNARRR